MNPAAHLLAWAGLAAAIALPLGLLFAPADAVQGEAQRFMYLHVPAAWCAYACFAVVLVANVSFLRRRATAAEALARAAAEVGVLLTALTLLTGSVWGKLTWGTWWAWDARVATTLAMGLVYVAYLGILGLRPGPAGRFVAALVGVAGFAVVPVVHLSVLWWRTLHQPPTILAPGTGMPIDPLMAVALAAAMVSMTLGVTGLVMARSRVLRSSGRREEVKQPTAAVGV